MNSFNTLLYLEACACNLVTFNLAPPESGYLMEYSFLTISMTIFCNVT